jgi:hypothetical protein
MMAVFVAITAVAVERYINKRRLRLHEVLADVGWWTLIFAAIEFGYLMFVEAFTLNFGAAARLLWYTEWSVFKNLMLDAAVGVLLIFASVWLESAGIRIELRRPQLRAGVTAVTAGVKPPQEAPDATAVTRRERCDIEWREAS